MIIMAVAYYDCINDWQVFDMAWNFCISLWAYRIEWTAPFLEHRIKQNPETAGEFNIVTRVAEPCGP